LIASVAAAVELSVPDETAGGAEGVVGVDVDARVDDVRIDDDGVTDDEEFADEALQSPKPV
jgi:hypothetical protein